MTPEGIRERFDFYRKWFRSLLIKEFMNLPSRYQERFMVLLEKFTRDCKRTLQEGKSIQEKTIKLIVNKVHEPDNKEENYTISGKIEGTENYVKISFPVSKSRPEKGKKLNCTVYSIDGKIWYSSKEELITGRSR